MYNTCLLNPFIAVVVVYVFVNSRILHIAGERSFITNWNGGLRFSIVSGVAGADRRGRQSGGGDKNGGEWVIRGHQASDDFWGRHYAVRPGRR